uniref:YqaJ viral recombinase domain-containing protein n=1 Tax=Strigamia maritima TaxID=126957 RepID=T1ILH2_STRMM
MEDVAVAEYLRTMESSGKRVVAAVCGLYVHPTVSYLAATPDRTVEDLEEDPTEGILEVKCPKSMDKKTIIEACKTKTFCLEMTNSKACLKHKHEYYFQIQGQLAVTRRQWCDVVVYTEVDIHIERIWFDPGFWEGTLLKLNYFLKHALVPELILRRIQNGSLLYCNEKYVGFKKDK